MKGTFCIFFQRGKVQVGEGRDISNTRRNCSIEIVDEKGAIEKEMREISRWFRGRRNRVGFTHIITTFELMQLIPNQLFAQGSPMFQLVLVVQLSPLVDV